MDRKPYASLSEAYMKMFEAPEKPGKPPMGMPVPVPYMPLRPVNIHRTNVEIDVTQPYVGPGGVEKAYYSYPAGFDPTNREDVIKDKDYDGSKARPEAAKMTKEELEQVDENRFAAHGGKDTDAGAKYAKPFKGGRQKGVYTMKGKDGKPLFDKKEDIEVVGDYLMEAGLVDSSDQVDSFFTHMSDEWKSHIIEKACWDTHKKVGMKKKGGKMVNDCVPK